MTTKEARSLIEWARNNGAQEIKIGEIEVKFAPLVQLGDTAFDADELKKRVEGDPDAGNLFYYSS
tara:strand:- start:170 stop:364 length:195 start_codon:yes stop_codon:yes gene_type:complete